MDGKKEKPLSKGKLGQVSGRRHQCQNQLGRVQIKLSIYLTVEPAKAAQVCEYETECCERRREEGERSLTGRFQSGTEKKRRKTWNPSQQIAKEVKGNMEVSEPHQDEGERDRVGDR